MRGLILGFGMTVASVTQCCISSIALTTVFQERVIAAPRPSKALVNAVKKSIPEAIFRNADLVDRSEYFVAEVDLNGDGVKEAVVVIATPMCGVNECSAYVYQKTDDRYEQIGRLAVQSDNAAIGVLKSKRAGWTMYASSSARTPMRKC